MLSLTALELLELKPADLERLHAEHGAGLTASLLSQTRVKLRHLYVAPQVFQPRIFVEESWIKRAHIRELVTAIKQSDGKGLEPILVFPVGGYRVIVDGHCRAEAYRRIDRSGEQSVPVRHLTGSFRDALFLAASGNSHDKLPLTQREKAEMAWRIVCSEEGRADAKSMREIERATGCSKSLVGKMRETLRLHPSVTEGTTTRNPRDETWRVAQRAERPKLDEFDREAWKEKWIADAATQLRKTFGKKPERQYDLFLEAVERAYPGFNGVIAEAYREYDKEETSEF